MNPSNIWDWDRYPSEVVKVKEVFNAVDDLAHECSRYLLQVHIIKDKNIIISKWVLKDYT